MPEKSKISIVTISFNQAAFLQDAISSVSCSDPSRLQYVIVDPGSSDGSRAIIEGNRGRFSHVLLEPDQGPADGLNRGFALCDGNLFGYINSDDRFCQGALDFVLDYFDRSPDVDVLCGAIRIISREGRPHLRKRTPDKINLRRFAYSTCYIWQQATFFRREIFLKVGGFNPTNRVHWDSELVVDMVLRGARVGYVRTLLGEHRYYEGTITGSPRFLELNAIDGLRVRDKILRAGHAPFTNTQQKAMRLIYKLNIRRHLSYLFGTQPLRQ